MISYSFFVIFYTMTNLVPANTQQFQMAWQSSTVRTMRINFEKKDNRWTITPTRGEEYTLTLWSDKKGNLHMKENDKKEVNTKVKVADYIGEKDHKDWQKITYFYLKNMGKEGEKAKLNITERGKKFIQIKIEDDKGEFHKFQGIKLNWK